MPSHCRCAGHAGPVRSNRQRGSRTNAAVQWNDIVHQPFAFRKDRVLRYEEDCNQLERANLGYYRLFQKRSMPAPAKGGRSGTTRTARPTAIPFRTGAIMQLRDIAIGAQTETPWRPEWRSDHRRCPGRHGPAVIPRLRASVVWLLRPSPFLQRRILLRRRLLSARLHGKPVAWPELSPAALARASRCRRRDHQRRCRARL